MEDPHPTREYPDQKVWVWVPFSCLMKKGRFRFTLKVLRIYTCEQGGLLQRRKPPQPPPKKCSGECSGRCRPETGCSRRCSEKCSSSLFLEERQGTKHFSKHFPEHPVSARHLPEHSFEHFWGVGGLAPLQGAARFANLHTKKNLEDRNLLIYLVNLFLTNLVRLPGFSSLFLAIAVLSALFAREC